MLLLASCLSSELSCFCLSSGFFCLDSVCLTSVLHLAPFSPKGKTIKNFVFPGFGGIWGDRFARKTGKPETKTKPKNKRKKTKKPFVLILLSCPFFLPCFFSLFQFLFCLVFFCCFDSTESNQSN